VAGERLASPEASEDFREEALGLLSQLWSRSQGDAIPYARLAVLDAASRVGKAEPARDLLRLGLDDPDPRVRARSRDRLATVFEEIHEEQQRVDSGKSLEEYGRIVRWSLEPRAAKISVEREGFLPGWFTVRLDSARTPLTCWNFAQLARSGFYDGMVIHQVVPNFVVQAGDPRGDGHGGPGYPLRSEVSSVAFVAGTLGMAKIDGMTHGSQWFITLSAQSHLDGEFTAFGNVVQNLPGVVLQMEPGDRIVSIEVYRGDGTERPRLPREGEEPSGEVSEEPGGPARPGS
jgi:cyclophilin family peptidyl-prolyl cis-trans isomerase